jgi:hypothetical protein
MCIYLLCIVCRTNNYYLLVQQWLIGLCNASVSVYCDARTEFLDICQKISVLHKFKINICHVAVTVPCLNPCRPLAYKSVVQRMQSIVAYGGVEKHIHSFFALGLAWGKWSAVRPVYLRGRSPQYVTNRWLGEPQLLVWMLFTRGNVLAPTHSRKATTRWYSTSPSAGYHIQETTSWELNRFSCGIWRRLVWQKFTYVSEKPTAYCSSLETKSVTFLQKIWQSVPDYTASHPITHYST